MVIKEKRFMSTESLRNLFIERKWFTRGTNAEYERLLEMTGFFDTHIGPLTLFDMATSIMNHSSEEAMEGIQLTDIMAALARICIPIYEVEEE